MKMISTLPTDKFGDVYYGPKTFAAAEQCIDDGARTARDVAEMLDDAGYTGVAARVRREYGIPVIVGTLGEFGRHNGEVVTIVQTRGNKGEIRKLWNALDDADAIEQDEIFQRLESLGAVICD